jgi:hypothetical protein
MDVVVANLCRCEDYLICGKEQISDGNEEQIVGRTDLARAYLQS